MALMCRWRSRPQHQKRTNAPQQTASLFDHLVGEQLYRIGQREAERIGGVEVDDQFELGGLHDWQIARLSTFENLARVDSALAISIRNARTVADQPPRNRIFAKL
jgi:hypothetical protein